MSGQLNSPWLSTSDLLAPVNALYQHQLEDAQSQSLLGDLAVKQQTLGLEYQKLAQQRAAGAALLGNQQTTPTDGSSTTTSGSTSSGGGGGSFLDTLASVESGDKNIVSNTDKDSNGLTLAQGGNPAEISQGHFQIQTATWRDFAKQAGVDTNQYPNAMSAPRDVQARVASVIPFNRFGPRTQTLMASRFGPLDTSQTVGTLAGAPALTFNPDTAGPRVGGTATASSDQLPVPPIPPPAGDPNPANMAAVKQAATGLLAMPEADAATAYPGVVQELQSRGFAMNAPPTYPGHARLQAMVNGGTAAALVPVAPSPIAARTAGTDVAGPGAGPGLPDVPTPNRLYDTGLPGVQISGPGNALAPPDAAAPIVAPTAAVAAPPAGTTASPGGTGKPPVPIPPSAPSRMIQTEPTYQSGPMMGLTASQGREAAAMVAGGTPVTDVAAKMEAWRQQNITNRQTAATANVAQQTLDATRQQQYYENQVKAGWEDVGNGVIRNRFTGETKYAGPPTPRLSKDEQGNTIEVLPGGETKVVSANPSGVTGSGPDASALRTLNEVGPRIAAANAGTGPPVSPQDQANYASAAEIYRDRSIVTDPVTKSLIPVYKRDLPPGFPPSPFQPASAPGGSGPQPITQGMTPAQQAAETKLGEDFASTDKKSYDAANTSLGMLTSANNAADILNRSPGGWTATGPGANTRMELASRVNQVAGMFGSSPVVDPAQNGGWENLNKQTKLMGMQVVNNYFGGSREAASIINGATTAVPNSENSYLGFRMVSSAIEQDLQRQRELYQFKAQRLAAGQPLTTAEVEFNKQNPAQSYTQRAIANAVPNDIVAHLVANPATVTAFDKHFGPGIGEFILKGGRTGMGMAGAQSGG